MLETQALTNANRTDSIHSNPNLVSGLFFEREIDPDLALVHDRWPKLPEHIKAAVLALVRSAPDKERAL